MSFFSYDMLKNLKPGEFAVYNFIISHMEKIPSMNIRELAEITGVSTTTVLRFCEKAGCEGYTEFKYRIKCRMSEPEGRNNYDSAPALQFIKNAERDELFQDKLGEVADLIAQSGQVIFSGDGEGRSLAQYGIYLFNSVGKAAFRCEKENGTVCPEKEIKSMLFTINEQISNFAQSYPANSITASIEAPLLINRYRFVSCSCFSCFCKKA